jgi:hypothetical protein
MQRCVVDDAWQPRHEAVTLKIGCLNGLGFNRRGSGHAGLFDHRLSRLTMTSWIDDEQRYSYLFQYPPVALLQVETSRHLELFDEVRAQDVIGFETYLNDMLVRFTDRAKSRSGRNEHRIPAYRCVLSTFALEICFSI